MGILQVPGWRFDDDDSFEERMQACIVEWRRQRGPGLHAIESFNEGIVAAAKSFLRTTHIEARSAHHKFDTAIALLSKLQSGNGNVDAAELSKL